MAMPPQILRLTGSSGSPAHLANPVMVAQEVMSRLMRSFRQLRGPSYPCALNIPLEVILQIATYLDVCALVSLSLTCKSFHALWEPRRLRIYRTDKERLLLLLEKDIPFLYYCHYCTKLHRWHRRWCRCKLPRYQESLECKRSLSTSLWLPGACHVPYFHARLVMNRHLYGPNQGLPLRILNKRPYTCHRPNGVAISVSQHARIVDDHLLVLSKIAMRHSRGDSLSLRNHIDSHGHPVCQHLILWEGFPHSPRIQLPELAKRTRESPFVACGPAFGSCNSCPTDYSITITWKGRWRGFNIEVLVYRDLGECRTPFSWHWEKSSTFELGEESRSAYAPDCRPGSIREQWNKASGIA